MDESDGDPRLPHHLNPKEFVPLDHLAGPFLLFYILRLVTLKLVLLITERGWWWCCRAGCALLALEPKEL